jgi:hypothetical protein
LAYHGLGDPDVFIIWPFIYYPLIVSKALGCVSKMSTMNDTAKIPCVLGGLRKGQLLIFFFPHGQSLCEILSGFVAKNSLKVRWGFIIGV